MQRRSGVTNFGSESPRTPSLTSEDTENSQSSSLKSDLVVGEPDQVPFPTHNAKNSGSPTYTAPSSPSHSSFRGGERAARPSRSNVSRPGSRFSLINWDFEYRLLYTALDSERILATLLQWLSWTDFAALLNASRDMRELMRNTSFRRVVFDRYVPGYRFASMAWDTRFADREPRTSITHLSYLMLALSVPLHIYPSHALSTLTSIVPLHQRSNFTQWLQTLALAYSRFSLILRFRSLLLPFNESWMDRPLPQSRNTSRQSAAESGPNKQIVKELVFPAPLMYFGRGGDPDLPELSNATHPPPALGLKPSHGSLTNRSQSSTNGTSSPSRHSSVTTKTASRLSKLPQPLPPRKKRMSIFGGKMVKPPPAPRSEPPSSMQFYSDGLSSGWKRAVPRGVSGSGPESSAPTSASDDDYSFLPPTKPWHRKTGSTHSQSSNSLTSLLSASPHSPSRSPGGILPKPPKDRGPHDLASCTIRTRAPVLRVFVPCSDITPDVLAEIDAQLTLSGLKEFMFKGDIICNLGHVPATPSSSNHLGLEWLVFDGMRIVPLEPSSVTHPLTHTFSSPFYHHSFMPVDPIVSVIIPKTGLPNTPLTLTVSHATIPSLSQLWVKVKKYAWVTSLYVDVANCVRHSIGEGWAGEWVLEGEGTKEGKNWIEFALKGETNLFWEVDSERSQHGRLWLRLLPQHQARGDLTQAMNRSSSIAARR